MSTDRQQGVAKAMLKIQTCSHGIAMLDRELKTIQNGKLAPKDWADNYELAKEKGGWKIKRFRQHGISWLELVYSGKVPGVMELAREALGGVITNRPGVYPNIWISLPS